MYRLLLRGTAATYLYHNPLRSTEATTSPPIQVTQTYQLYNLTEDISESFDVSAGNEDLVEEMVTELKSFGPCYDEVGKFRVGFTANGKPIRKTCAWFATKKTRMRCLKWPLGQDFCRLTCAMANKKLC